MIPLFSIPTITFLTFTLFARSICKSQRNIKDVARGITIASHEVCWRNSWVKECVQVVRRPCTWNSVRQDCIVKIKIRYFIILLPIIISHLLTLRIVDSELTASLLSVGLAGYKLVCLHYQIILCLCFFTLITFFWISLLIIYVSASLTLICFVFVCFNFCFCFFLLLSLFDSSGKTRVNTSIFTSLNLLLACKHTLCGVCVCL